MVLYQKNHCIWKIKHFLNARTLSLPFKQFEAKGQIADTAKLWSQRDCGKCQIYGPGGDWLTVLWCVWCFVLSCVCFFFFSFEPLTETEFYKLSGDLPRKQKEAVSCTSPGI